ncbi:MAG TPA: hypothetical protein VN809_15000 [Telmatospirillum sp.]|nr:hypothetical protein [Telmatospirillum sp.]
MRTLLHLSTVLAVILFVLWLLSSLVGSTSEFLHLSPFVVCWLAAGLTIAGILHAPIIDAVRAFFRQPPVYRRHDGHGRAIGMAMVAGAVFFVAFRASQLGDAASSMLAPPTHKGMTVVVYPFPLKAHRILE